MVKKKENKTEEHILDAAKDIFQLKGMDGARMQEIADKAGINKAMLHYYYRSKQKLFEAVFKSAINLMAPKIIRIIETEDHLFDKIRNFTNKYISFISKHAYIPSFIIQELNRNPEMIKEIFEAKFQEHVKINLIKQIEDLVESGEIKPIKPEHLLINIISMSVFPFIAKPLLSAILQKSERGYKQLIKERKTHVAEFIIDSIKIKK
jgi:AcrR family transcriptional regulator